MYIIIVYDINTKRVNKVKHIMKTFISNLKKIMETEGLDLAKLSARCGIDKSVMQSFLDGKIWPKPSELAQMADYMSLPFESLLCLICSAL